MRHHHHFGSKRRHRHLQLSFSFACYGEEKAQVRQAQKLTNR
jgi:hypothetical protein